MSVLYSVCDVCNEQHCICGLTQEQVAKMREVMSTPEKQIVICNGCSLEPQKCTCPAPEGAQKNEWVTVCDNCGKEKCICKELEKAAQKQKELDLIAQAKTSKALRLPKEYKRPNIDQQFMCLSSVGPKEQGQKATDMAIFVWGVFPSRDEAKQYAAAANEKYQDFDIFVVPVGMWIPLPLNPVGPNTHYSNPRENNLMKQYFLQQAKAEKEKEELMLLHKIKKGREQKQNQEIDYSDQ
jgi:hypothetical protein